MDYGYAPATRKDKLIEGLVLLVIVALAAIFMFTYFGEHQKAITGEHSVKWQYVNVREEPSTDSSVVDQLSHGEKVTLTGHIYRHTDGPNADWVEVLMGDGTAGWVVAESVTSLS